MSHLKDSGLAQTNFYFYTNFFFIFHVSNVCQTQLKAHSPIIDIAVVLLDFSDDVSIIRLMSGMKALPSPYYDKMLLVVTQLY